MSAVFSRKRKELHQDVPEILDSVLTSQGSSSSSSSSSTPPLSAGSTSSSPFPSSLTQMHSQTQQQHHQEQQQQQQPHSRLDVGEDASTFLTHRNKRPRNSYFVRDENSDMSIVIPDDDDVVADDHNRDEPDVLILSSAPPPQTSRVIVIPDEEEVASELSKTNGNESLSLITQNRISEPQSAEILFKGRTSPAASSSSRHVDHSDTPVATAALSQESSSFPSSTVVRASPEAPADCEQDKDTALHHGTNESNHVSRVDVALPESVTAVVSETEHGTHQHTSTVPKNVTRSTGASENLAPNPREDASAQQGTSSNVRNTRPEVVAETRGADQETSTVINGSRHDIHPEHTPHSPEITAVTSQEIVSSTSASSEIVHRRARQSVPTSEEVIIVGSIDSLNSQLNGRQGNGHCLESAVNIDSDYGGDDRDTDDEEDEEVVILDVRRPGPRLPWDYPAPDNLPRVPGVPRLRDFSLPSLQRLSSRSADLLERQARRRNNRFGSLESEDADEDEDEDRYGRDTTRIDNEVREELLDENHPWAQGPIELIRTGTSTPSRQRLHSAERRASSVSSTQLVTDGADADDLLDDVDYPDHESDDDGHDGNEHDDTDGGDDEGDDDERTELSVTRSDTWATTLVQRMHGQVTRSSTAPILRSPPLRARSPFSFPTVRPIGDGRHNNGPIVARAPSPVPLILSRNDISRSRPGQDREDGEEITFRAAQLSPPPPRRARASTHDSHQWPSLHLKCPICLRLPTEPTTTRCGHLFCRDCIEQARAHGGSRSSAKCPTCRAPLQGLQHMEFSRGC